MKPTELEAYKLRLLVGQMKYQSEKYSEEGK